MLVVAALAACVCLAAGLRSSRLVAGAEGEFGNARIEASEMDRARGRLEDAKRFNPDETPAIRQAQLLVSANRDREAIQAAQEVVEREPENYEAWLVLRQAAFEVDPPLFRRATETALRLNPLASRSRDRR